MSLTREQHTVGEPLAGSIVATRMVINGWGPDLDAVSDQGRMHLAIEAGPALNLYDGPPDAAGSFANETLLAADTTLTGMTETVAVSAVLATASGGISGTCEIRGAIGGRLLIVTSYADELDIEPLISLMDDLLDGTTATANWRGGDPSGGIRFERAFMLAKKRLDPEVRNLLSTRLDRRTSDKRHALWELATPRELAEVHAYMTAAILLENSASETSELVLAQARAYRKDAKALLATLQLSIDKDQDDDIEAERVLGHSNIWRT